MWYAVIEQATGELYSLGTVLADPLPTAYKAIELGDAFDPEGREWDKVTLTFVPESIFDNSYFLKALKDILNIPELLILTLAQKQALKDKIIFYFS